MTAATEQTAPVEYFYLLHVTWGTPTGYANGFSRGVVVLPPTVTTRVEALRYLLADRSPVNKWPESAQVAAFTLELNRL